MGSATRYDSTSAVTLRSVRASGMGLWWLISQQTPRLAAAIDERRGARRGAEHQDPFQGAHRRAAARVVRDVQNVVGEKRHVGGLAVEHLLQLDRNLILCARAPLL